MNAADSARSAVWLLGPLTVALLCGVLLVCVRLLTGDQIEINERQQSRQALLQLLAGSVEEGLLLEADWSADAASLCLPRLLVLRQATGGYAGEIRMLLAVALEEPPVLNAVTVIAHLETPGIADFLDDDSAAGWLAALRGRTAADLQQTDTVSGATISSRAVQDALVRALQDAAESDCAGGPSQ